MRVLITGADGFLGRHARKAWANHDLTCVDIKSGIDCRWVFDTNTHFDVVLHFASVIGGRAGIDNTPLTVATSHGIDAALFDWAARTKPAHVLYPSSSAAYPVDLQRRDFHVRLAEWEIDLNAPRLPDAAYGWVKLTGEHLAARARALGINVHVVRPFSGYGEDQSTDYPFGAFLDRARRKQDPFPIWGDGLQVRDWVHVDDIMATIRTVIDEDYPDPINIGTGIPTTFLALAEQIAKAHGYTPTLAPEPDKPTGVQWRVSNPIQLDALRPPRIDLAEGIARTVQ